MRGYYINIRHKYNRCIGNTNGQYDNKRSNNRNSINSSFIKDVADSVLSCLHSAVHIISWSLQRGLITRVLTLRCIAKAPSTVCLPLVAYRIMLYHVSYHMCFLIRNDFGARLIDRMSWCLLASGLVGGIRSRDTSSGSC